MSFHVCEPLCVVVCLWSWLVVECCVVVFLAPACLWSSLIMRMAWPWLHGFNVPLELNWDDGPFIMLSSLVSASAPRLTSHDQTWAASLLAPDVCLHRSFVELRVVFEQCLGSSLDPLHCSITPPDILAGVAFCVVFCMVLGQNKPHKKVLEKVIFL